MKAIPHFCTILYLFVASLSLAQKVEITSPTLPNVCEIHTIKLKITNDKSTAVNNIPLQINLPCGFEYIKTSAVNAVEQDIADLSNPRFNIGSITSSKSVEVIIKVNISCKAYDCIDAQNVFEIGVDMTFDGQNIKAKSQPFNVNTPQIAVAFIEPGISAIEPNKILKRAITIKNTRRGRLASFIIKDTYEGNLSINIPQAQLINQTNKSVEFLVDSTVFKTIGNGDKYFDFNEVLILTEDVKLLSCSDRKLPLLSTINTEWGCGDVCQTTTTYATVTPTFILDIGERIFAKATAQDPKCYDTGTALQRFEVLENTHQNPIVNLTVRIDDNESNRGIIVSTLTLPQGAQVEFIDRNTNACGQMLAGSVIIKFASLEAYIGTTTRSYPITWQTGFCEETSCITPPTSWTYKLNYEKDCARDGDKAYSKNGKVIPAVPLFVSIESKLSSYVNAAKDTLSIVFRSGLITTSMGIAKFIIQIPKEFTISTNNLIFDGKAPLSVNVTEDMGNKYLALEYPMPFSATSLTLKIPITYFNTSSGGSSPCTPKYFSSCPNFCPNSGSGLELDGFSVTVRLDFNNNCPQANQPYECANSDEVELTSGDIINTCLDTLEGHLNFTVDFKRKNIGLPDRDLDLWPENFNGLLSSEIVTGAILPGDTFSLVYKGCIVADIPGATFANLKNRLSFSDLKSSSALNLEFMKRMMISSNRANKIISSTLKVKDHSTGKTYQINGLTDSLSETTLYTDLSVAKLRQINPSIPLDFKYSDADSIYWEVTRFIDPQEYVKSKDTLKYNQYLECLMLPKFALSDPKYEAGREIYGCLCPEFDVFFGGFNNAYNNNIFYLHHDSIMCSGREIKSNFQSNFVLGYVFESKNKLSNITEIRDITQLLGFEMEESPLFDYHTMRIKFKDSIVLIQPIKLSNGNLYFDFQNVLPVGYHVKNGFEMSFIKYLKDVCVNTTPKNLKFQFYIKSKGTADIIIPDTLSGLIGDKYVLPAIKLVPLQTKITAFDNKISTTVDFRQSATYDFKVKNVYCRMRYSPLITELRLFNIQNGQNLEPLNDIYQLGEIKKNGSVSFGINGRARSCGTEIIYFDYGFACDTVSDLATQPCFLFTDSIVIDFQEAAIDLETDDSPQEISLCEESNQIIEIFNTQLGTAYELHMNFDLPTGMDIVPGSAKLRFPSINGTTLNIPDPKSLGNRKYEWDFKDIWNLHKTQGLSGTTFEPKNAFVVEYKTITNCDFLSGTSIIYNIGAIQICGSLTNSVAKVTNSLNIENTSPPYTVDLSSDFEFVPDCKNDTLHLDISMVNPKKGNFKIHLGLDSSYTLISSTLNGFNSVPNTGGGDWKWDVNNINTDSIKLNITVVKPKIAFCSSTVIQIYTSVPTQAICKGVACNIGIVTGQSKITIPAINRSLDLNLASIELSGASSGLLTLDVNNQGENLSELKVDIYADVDKDGQWSAGDTLVTSTTIQGISAGVQTIYGDITPTINPNQLCNLIVVIDDSDQCICNTSSFPIESTVKLAQNVIVCAGDSLIIGPQGGTNGLYQWTEGSDLSCTQCPNPTFSAANPTLNPLTITKTCIFTSTEGCRITYDYNITISANPLILNGNAQLCKGDTLRITATAAIAYAWTGENIISNNGNTLVAVPSQSGIYTVTLTDQNGCTGTAMTTVTISESPTYALEYDSIYCYGLTPTINLITDSTNKVTWINGIGKLDDINSFTPKVLNNEDFVFKVEIDNGFCIKVVDVPVDFEQKLVLTGILDSITICPGTTLTVKLPFEYTYTFDSPITIICNNPECSEISFTANNDVKIEVIAQDDEGCTAKQFIVVDLNTELAYSEQKFSFCEGDSITIFGQTYSKVGTYCDTIINQFTGCRQVFCKIIEARPPNLFENQIKICEGDSIVIDGIAFFDNEKYCRVRSGNSNECDTTFCTNILILPLPDVSSIITTYTIEEGRSIVINAPLGFASYNWSPSIGLSCTDCPSPTVTADSTREYTLTLIDNNGCINRTKIKIDVTTSCASIIDKIPNAFTPNGDGQNDIYTLPKLENCGPVRLQVFNRWGNIVYEDPEWDNQWDGRSKSSDRLPQGTYYIALTFSDLGITKTTMVDLRVE